MTDAAAVLDRIDIQIGLIRSSGQCMEHEECSALAIAAEARRRGVDVFVRKRVHGPSGRPYFKVIAKRNSPDRANDRG